jgi:broad specificity phosphatase PhoE
MRFYFIRHGETDYNRQRRLQGNLDISLNDTGRKQAIQAVDDILNLGIDCIISSPQIRALETAEIISEKIGNVPIEIDENLRERSFGILEGMSFDEILAKHPKFMDIIVNPEGIVVPDSESIKDVENRVVTFIDQIKGHVEEKKILVVSHGGTGRVFHKVVNDQADFHLMDLDNCQVITFEL